MKRSFESCSPAAAAQAPDSPPIPPPAPPPQCLVHDIPVSPQLHLILNTQPSLSKFLYDNLKPSLMPTATARSLRPHRLPIASQLLPVLGGGMVAIVIVRLMQPHLAHARESKMARGVMWRVLGLRSPEGQLLKAEGMLVAKAYWDAACCYNEGVSVMVLFVVVIFLCVVAAACICTRAMQFT